MSFAALFPGFVHSVAMDNRQQRLYRVRLPGLTDGAAVQPRAKVLNALGDKSTHTEIRILPGDPVWIAFERGDTRAPIIVGYRTLNDASNEVGWRRWEHDNIEFNADAELHIIAGTRVRVTTPLALVDAQQTHCTGALTVDGLLTFNGGMTGKGGAGGGKAITVQGGADFTEDVTANGVSVSGHDHTARGANAITSPPNRTA